MGIRSLVCAPCAYLTINTHSTRIDERAPRIRPREEGDGSRRARFLRPVICRRNHAFRTFPILAQRAYSGEHSGGPPTHCHEVQRIFTGPCSAPPSGSRRFRGAIFQVDHPVCR